MLNIGLLVLNQNLELKQNITCFADREYWA